MPSALNSPPAGAHVEFTGKAFAGDNSTSYAGVRKMYRTGDVGYLVGGGRLEICGRCDSMVKYLIMIKKLNLIIYSNLIIFNISPLRVICSIHLCIYSASIINYSIRLSLVIRFHKYLLPATSYTPLASSYSTFNLFFTPNNNIPLAQQAHRLVAMKLPLNQSSQISMNVLT
jgi:hypothetical protein